MAVFDKSAQARLDVFWDIYATFLRDLLLPPRFLNTLHNEHDFRDASLNVN